MTVVLTRAAEKDMNDLSSEARARAITALRRLQDNPVAGHTLTDSLRGVRSLEFSAPGGVYRAAYIIDEENCVVFLVRPHEGFYKIAERRAQSLR